MILSHAKKDQTDPFTYKDVLYSVAVVSLLSHVSPTDVRALVTLIAVWSKALPMMASYLSQLPWLESHPWHVRKLPVTWGLRFSKYV